MTETEKEAVLHTKIGLTAGEWLAIEADSDELLAFAITDPIVARQQVLVQETEKLEEANLKEKAAEHESAEPRLTLTHE